MDALYETFNAVSPALVANEIRIVAGQGGKQQVVRVQALHKESKHSFIYYSLQHAAEDVHSAVEEVAHTILRDHPMRTVDPTNDPDYPNSLPTGTERVNTDAG